MNASLVQIHSDAIFHHHVCKNKAFHESSNDCIWLTWREVQFAPYNDLYKMYSIINTVLLYCICICFDGVVIGAQCTATFFRIYCAPPNLGITRTWICRLNFAQRLFFQAWGSLTSLKSQTLDPQLKVLPRGKSWKNPSTSAGFEPVNLGSRGEHITSRPPRTTDTVL